MKTNRKWAPEEALQVKTHLCPDVGNSQDVSQFLQIDECTSL